MRDITPLLNMPCTVTTVTDGPEDEYGDPTETTTDTHTVCWIDRRGVTTHTAETVGEEKWQIDTLDCYLPPNTNINGLSRVTVSGMTYDVLGPPHTYTHPRTLQPVYVHAVVRRVS